MTLKNFKILAMASVVVVFILNIYLAANFYNISSIHLSNEFYWQSINDVLVDNKVEKVQLYGEGIDIGFTQKKDTLGGRIRVIYQIKRDSYRRNW
ncbi:hypothetical protein [Mucilaginibacter sp. UR6-11]|uniref:hypothetical protein n=1 Tax=Mucilaginibacter sp. UR6-11 TaxID=1435644 RepID=UPI001E399CB0|nr:hypothetical protein [Mucilaginibacter sp. UR6-11]MCC8427314.1 hypothetical protein [Mucilaginibacter sp. UR6-11]